ncbi:MAG: hypothetical protein GXY83_12425 [Rhodopirellula sp.]|nr:hypothetical protein [Rhodopirellula sp.]
MYRILIHSTSPILNNPDWHDCGEGPFHTADEVTTFAEAEVVGLDPFGLSPTTTFGNMKLEIADTWHEHAIEHTDLAIRGNLSLNVGVGVIRGLDGEGLGSFAFCPHCGILKLSRERGAWCGEPKRVES